MRLCQVVLVDGRGVSNEFSKDDRISPARVLEGFQGEHRRAFTKRQAIALGIEGTADGG